jgi:peroxiredoxin
MTDGLLLVAILLLCAGCWLGVQLLRQSGRLLTRLDELESRLPQAETRAGRVPPAREASPRNGPTPAIPHLRVGESAPEWTLPNLSGEPTALTSFRGRAVLLIFFNPGCGFCVRMAPDLAALPVDGAAGRPLPLVVTTGDADPNQAFMEKHGIRCPVVVQEAMTTAQAYQVSGTPMGYLLDEEGRIASGPAVGASALLELAGLDAEGRAARTATDRAKAETAAKSDAHPAHRGNRSLADSKINRGGLAPGTQAPGFRLPRVGGGEVALEETEGERLLLFIDPNCGPCDELAPRLQALHQQNPSLRIIAVSRGDEAENATKAARLGLTFPIALQKRYEVSRLYESYATPAAFRLDPAGRTVAPVALGADAILALAEAGGTPA